MSQSGVVLYYVTEEIRDPELVLAKLVSWLGAHWLLFAHRTIGESRALDLMRKYDLDQVDSPFPKQEDVCKRCHPEQLRGKLKAGTELSIDFSTAPRTEIFCQAHALMPESLRGEFNPGTPIVSIGWHDLVDERPDDRRLVARAFLTVRVWGYGTPRDDARYRQEIWNQPFAQDFERELASLVAPHPVHHAVVFSY
jgi:hypothetical protein